LKKQFVNCQFSTFGYFKFKAKFSTLLRQAPVGHPVNADNPSNQPLPSTSPYPAGYSASADLWQIGSDREVQALMQAAGNIVSNPLELRRFTERVYALLRSDLLAQQERQGRDGGRY
jgi:hypothetical protein